MARRVRNDTANRNDEFARSLSVYSPKVDSAAQALKVLLDLTGKLGDERSLKKALKLVTNAALELLPGDHASIRVLDHTRTELLSGARSGTGYGKKPVRHSPGQGVAGWVVEHGELANVSDTQSDERFVTKANQGFEIRSILAVPLWSAGEVVGVLAATSMEPAKFDADDEALASLLANCAVPPIEKARLARLAITDAQTMVFNHAYLIPGLRAEMKKVAGTSSTLSVLLMDLDAFKRVNDRHGHASGDHVLRHFADMIRQSTRDRDVVVRRGGDEFVLIMPGASKQDARIAAERIRSTLAQSPIELASGEKIDVTVSIGAAAWDGSESPEGLERRADDAMYAAKLHGRNRVHFSGDDASSTGEHRIEDAGPNLVDIREEPTSINTDD